ncbi:MAG: ferrochelatase [Anaerolineales bacterium]|nr:ferrochelatase [Anaerolineales bacterium]MCW5854719.1 ferrochelatase [Anaerolineales bacterium]
MTQKGILLINLGSPDSPTPEDVRPYLEEFLMDERVLDYPYPIRRMAVSLFILPKRPYSSAEAYQSIWWPEGSPLVVISQRLREQVQARTQLPVALGMRYGNPSIRGALRELLDAGAEQIYAIPLYPQFAMPTVETCIVETAERLAELHPGMTLETHPPFYNDPRYIGALVESARPYVEGHDHLLFSYHGVPERHLRKSDPTGGHCLSSPDCCSQPSPAHATCYRHQSLATTEAVAGALGLEVEDYSVGFQSRLGPDTWMRPFTVEQLTRLAHSGVKRLAVICPAFVADCVETLEEIGLRGRETFLEAGGEALTLVPCLNTNEDWVETVVGWVNEVS